MPHRIVDFGQFLLDVPAALVHVLDDLLRGFAGSVQQLIGTVYKRVTVYDMVNHTITFETDHFSYYVIGDESAFDSSSEEDSSSMIVTAVIVAVIAIAAVAIVAFCRKH